MDRTYISPCQKANYYSCEGCPEPECKYRHTAREAQAILATH